MGPHIIFFFGSKLKGFRLESGLNESVRVVESSNSPSRLLPALTMHWFSSTLQRFHQSIANICSKFRCIWRKLMRVCNICWATPVSSHVFYAHEPVWAKLLTMQIRSLHSHTILTLAWSLLRFFHQVSVYVDISLFLKISPVTWWIYRHVWNVLWP